MLRRRLKLGFLVASKYLGLFQLARFLTRRQLRILCYHGTALDDEAKFRPLLFIDAETFEQRLRYLSRPGFAVLPLDEAVERLRQGTLPANAVVLTIDDGFYGTYRHAIGLLKQYRQPATLYVTTYYSQHQNPIFRLLVQYIFWMSKKDRINLTKLAIEGFEGEAHFRRSDIDDPVMWKIIEHGETRLDEDCRHKLSLRLAALLGVDIEHILKHRCLGLMNAVELEQVRRDGVDIELHSHRHRFPESESSAKREITDNRAVLEPITGTPCKHFCYPSGLWSEKHWPWLEELGIKSATTCDVGFNRADAHPLALRRVFDSSAVSAVEFEAELNGYLELLRRTKAAIAKIRRRSSGVRGAASTHESLGLTESATMAASRAE